MAMFPPAPPETPLETRGGPTSGFFQRQERAFFAQAGKEIFRVRVEIDMAPHAPEMEGAHVKTRPRDVNAPHAWPPPLPAHPPPNGSLSHHSSAHAASSPVALANPNGRPNQRSGVSITPGYPVNTHSPTLHHPPNLHSSPAGMTLRTPTQEAIPAASQRPKTEFPPEEFDPDEAWRRPIPYAERRRAGKHTKRVIVRS
ncbi:hypothetical protein AX15_006060 [Amanita polypyramis BW_CC]|nr:hypothetical protein AX15_006060 [Amanita polypyramis BW_CC]